MFFLAPLTVKAILFSGGHYILFWLKQKRVMPGTFLCSVLSETGFCFAYSQVSNNTELHWKFACALYSTLQHNKPSSHAIRELVADAVDLEKQIMSDAIKYNQVGVELEYLPRFVEFSADKLMVELGQNKMFHTENPCIWSPLKQPQSCGRRSPTPISSIPVFTLDADF